MIRAAFIPKSEVFWLALALACGLLIATQPLAVVLLGLGLIAYLILSCITPIAALMVLIIISPLRTLIATEAGWQFPLDIGQIALVVFIAAWLFHHIALRASLPLLRWTPVYLPLALVLAATALSVINAASLSAWLREWLKWAQMLLMVLITLNLASGQRWRWWVIGLALAGLVNAFIGLYVFFGGSGALHLLINDRFFRAFGTFGQPNPFGGFMGLLAPIVLMAALAYGLRWRQRQSSLDFLLALFFSLISMFLVLGIVTSWSRGAWLAFGAAILMILLALPRRFWHGFLFAAALSILALVLWVTGLLPQSIVERISSSTADYFTFADMRGIDITPDNYPVAERLAHWQAALTMAQAHPWLGVGFGNYEVVYPNYRLINWHEPLGHAHNYYLNMLAESGLVGLLGYGKAWVLIMALNWRLRKHPDLLARLVGIGLLGTWTYLAVHSLFDNLYVNNLFIHIGLMLGLLAVLYNQINESKALRST